MTDAQLFLKNLYNSSEVKIPATNTWINGDVENNSLKSDRDRGSDSEKFCNAFIRVTGVDDKTHYTREIFYWKNKLENMGKNVCVVEGLQPATVLEVQRISPQNYTTVTDLLGDLTRKISCKSSKIRNQAIKGFIDCVVEDSEHGNFGRLRNRSISLVAWFNRYAEQIFKTENPVNIPTFIYFGACSNETEGLFLKLLASLPVDVILLNPNSENKCVLADSRLFDVKYENSMVLDKFPIEIDNVHFSTVAYGAEKDLETMIYDDTGLFKLRQHDNAVAVTLKTMYEEIYLLWNQEIKIRPSFEVLKEKVVIPTITAKVSGVKDKDLTQYWRNIKNLDGNDSYIITEKSFYDKQSEKFNTLDAFKIQTLVRENILKNSEYKYGIYREEIQNYILDKLEELINSRLIKGTFEKGTEHTILKVVMNLDKRILRLIQSLDFTKKNPKIVLVNPDEEGYKLEESIIIAFLHLIGFDILLFTPTGYRVIENHYTQPFFVEHSIGDFMYDLKIPDYILGEKIGENNSSEPQDGFLKKLLRR